MAVQESIDVQFTTNGKIIPSDAALRYVEREYSDKPPHEKWRLAQAVTLFDAYGPDQWR